MLSAILIARESYWDYDQRPRMARESGDLPGILSTRYLLGLGSQRHVLHWTVTASARGTFATPQEISQSSRWRSILQDQVTGALLE